MSDNSKDRLWPVMGLGGGMALIFIVACAFFAVRDGNAEARCSALGGQTWDSGTHCVLGHPKVVSTR